MPRLPTALLVWLLAAPVAAQVWPPPEEPYFAWTDLPFEPGEYERRRQAALRMMSAAGGGVLLVPGGDGVTHGETFRQEDGFNYFTGLEVPRSVLVLDGDAGTSHLFLPARDERFENPDRPNDFPGRRLRDDPALTRRTGLATRDPAELDGLLSSLAGDGTGVWVDAGRPGPVASVAPDLTGGIEPGDAFVLALRARHPSLRLENAFEAMARLRMVKSPAEIEVLRGAAAATMAAIRRAAQSVTPGVDERTLEGEFEAGCKASGAQRVAFASIVKSGPNSLWPWRVLAAHYDRRNRALATGELVIFDVGCELDYYASDVGRTFPVDGTFSDRQRSALELSTRVADAIIAHVRPGTSFAELLEVAVAEIPEDERRYMQTGSFFGHHVGLAVGDPSLPDVALEPGMVFTIEPWYYNHTEGVAVFVEDLVLVTAAGAEVLTSALPRDPASLEAMIAAGR